MMHHIVNSSNTCLDRNILEKNNAHTHTHQVAWLNLKHLSPCTPNYTISFFSKQFFVSRAWLKVVYPEKLGWLRSENLSAGSESAKVILGPFKDAEHLRSETNETMRGFPKMAVPLNHPSHE